MRKEVIISLMLLWFLMMGLSFKGCNTSAPAPPAIVENGTISHPYRVDAPIGTTSDLWQVQTVQGTQHWILSQKYGTRGIITLQAGQYILYGTTEYQLSGIDQPHHRFSAVVLGN